MQTDIEVTKPQFCDSVLKLHNIPGSIKQEYYVLALIIMGYSYFKARISPSQLSDVLYPDFNFFLSDDTDELETLTS
jgi:hypothetical protein